jgi:hypothetical protein
MKKEFEAVSNSTTISSDKDHKTVVEIEILREASEFRLHIRSQHLSRIAGLEWFEDEGKSMEIESIGIDKITRIKEALSDWFSSDSFPTHEYSLGRCSGVFKTENNTTELEGEFKFILDEDCSSFVIEDSTGPLTGKIDFPSKSNMNNSGNVGLNNLRTLEEFLGDFLNVETDGEFSKNSTRDRKNHHQEPVNRVIKICSNFGAVARKLEERCDGRETLEINDEYDVQDLFHSLLKLDFEDVRPEEPGPSHGGPSSRIDFLIKPYKIGVEVKLAEEGRANKKIKNELAEDKEHYRKIPDCQTLVCFVYNPESVLKNPSGFEKDLSEEKEEMDTIVVVS